ncbi:MAG: diguanylate cyclase [Rhodocyclales bacterium]|nr:diguanylate cyclase [Rhodocyclales bacterium]
MQRLLLITIGAALAWTVAVSFAVGRYYDSEASAAVAAAARQAEHEAASISDGIERMLAIRRGVAVTLAEDETVRRAVVQRLHEQRDPAGGIRDTPELRNLNRFLRAAEEHLKLDALWVGDAAGIGIAAQSADPRHSPLGVNYSDRIYYREARAGRVGYQYAVGRTSGLGGIYFSAPIMDGKRFAGFVLAKTNMSRLAAWVGQTEALLVDDAGVIVLASDPQLEMRTLPGASVGALSPAERQRQYARSEFQPLHIADWPDTRIPGLKRIDGRSAAVILHTDPIAEFGLQVTVLRPVGELAAIGRQRQLMILSLAGIGASLMAIGAVLAAYRRQSRAGEQALAQQRQQTEARLRLAASVFDNANEGICITDAEQRIVDVNPTLCQLTGYAREALIGLTPRAFQSGRQDASFYQAMWQAIDRDGHWHGDLWNRRRNGEFYAVRLTVSAVRDAGNRITHYIGIMVDITDSKQHVAQLEHVAHFDALTGLPNRLLLADRLRQAIAHTHRGDTFLAVCYLDLDEFKPINDQCGHDTGDRVLAEVGRRLDACLRGGDTVARLGGDEFVLLLSGLHRHEEYEATLHRVLDEMRAPLAIDGRSFSISASIGITLCPRHGTDQDELLRQADQAMYAAKQAGKNCWRIFEPGQDVAYHHG